MKRKEGGKEGRERENKHERGNARKKDNDKKEPSKPVPRAR